MRVLLVLSTLLLSGAAQAQTYVRPSKGAPITIASSVVATSVAATYTTSAMADWSSFAGVIITVNASTVAPTYSGCKYGVRVQALGSATTNAADFFLLNVANNDYRASRSQSWYIRVLPGYLKFLVGTYLADAAGQPSCTYRVVVTPLPFDYSGQLSNSGSYSEFFESTQTIQLPYGYPTIRIQNTDTSGLACYVRNPATGSFNTGGRYAFLLKKDSTGNTGDGGVIELHNYAGELRCTGEGYIVFGY